MKPLPLLLILLAAAACDRAPVPVEIEFAASFDGRPARCSSPGTAGLTDLRLYVHDVSLLGEDGRPVDAALQPDGAWQSADVAMIDLEDGSGRCVNGTPATNSILRLRADGTATTGLAFVVGVPFEFNHADPLTAGAPLDDTAMHWHWRSGYKFLRAGVSNADDAYWIHVGSTACDGTTRNITRCRSPNRIAVVLEQFDPASQVVVVDLDALLGGVDLGDGQPSDCASGPDEVACAGPFAALGLRHGDNRPAERPIVFRVEQRE